MLGDSLVIHIRDLRRARPGLRRQRFRSDLLKYSCAHGLDVEIHQYALNRANADDRGLQEPDGVAKRIPCVEGKLYAQLLIDTSTTA